MASFFFDTKPPTLDERIERVARTVFALRALPVQELLNAFEPHERPADFLLLEHLSKAIEHATTKLTPEDDD